MGGQEKYKTIAFTILSAGLSDLPDSPDSLEWPQSVILSKLVPCFAGFVSAGSLDSQEWPKALYSSKCLHVSPDSPALFPLVRRICQIRLIGFQSGF